MAKLKDVRLSQVLAVEKQIKNKCNDRGAEILKLLQKPELFDGHRRDFAPATDTSEQIPSDSKLVTYYVPKLLKEAVELQAELIDTTYTKDTGNCSISGTLTLNGKTHQVPVPFLLWMEKQLLDLKALFTCAPTLDLSKKWNQESSNLWATEPILVARNKKTPTPLVLYEATDKHPAQVQLIEKETLQGYWSISYISSAIPAEVREGYLARVEELLKEVKQAREEANAIRIPQCEIAHDLLAHIGLT